MLETTMKKRSIAGAALYCTLALLAPLSANAVTVVGTQTVLNKEFGVNVHLDNCCDGNYANIQSVIAQIKYIGATRLRDWASSLQSVNTWATVKTATGDKFHASIPETSPAHQLIALNQIASWLRSNPGLIDVIEGGNEEDDTYALSVGASLAQAAAMQPQVYAVGHSAGVLVDQLSVGAGWIAPLYLGDYESFGTPPADLGNAHVYMNPNSPPLVGLIRIGGLAAYSVPGKPVDVTEFGISKYLAQTEAVTSAYMHEAPFDAFALGYAGLFVYALHDDESGVVSFYDVSGNKRDFADYWHYTTQLLADPNGASLPAKQVALTFASLHTTGVSPLGIKNLPMYKSDGSLWIAAYDEERADAIEGSEKITFDHAYPSIKIVDARTGIVQSQETNAATITVPLPPNHIYFVVAR